MANNERVLKVYWSKRERDLMCEYPRRCDGALVINHFNDVFLWGGSDGHGKGWLNYKEFNLIKELVERGYDKTTFKFSIKLRDDFDLDAPRFKPD